MTSYLPVVRLFRSGAKGSDKVAFIELFFDLVFVFAVTQLSHHVIEHLTPGGVLEGVLMLAAVWSVWIYTTWVTNWMNPEKGPVRWMLIALMLAGIVLSTAIPEAFGDRALQFALAYVVMQVGRTVFVVISYRIVGQADLAENLLRIAIWFSFTGVLWIVGAVAGGQLQLILWGVAVVVETAGPMLLYRVPFMRKPSMEGFEIAGAHMAERAGLFMILALGESIIVTGTLFSRSDITPSTVLAFLSAFVGTILFWLLYFSHSAEHGSQFIDNASNNGRIGRLTYTYIHLLLVGGVVLVAVGDDLLLAHPDDPLETATAAIVVAAPALYLLGNLLFKRSIGLPWLRSHLLGMAALTVLFVAWPVIPGLTALALTWIVNGIVAIVVVVDEYVWPNVPEGHKGMRKLFMASVSLSRSAGGRGTQSQHVDRTCPPAVIHAL